MKKLLYVSLIILIGGAMFFSFFGEANAVLINFPNPLEYDTFGELVDAIIRFIFYIAVVITPLMIIIGAFYLLTAAGDPKRVGTGKTIIIYTLIGLALILLARAVIGMIEKIIGVKIGG